MPWKQGRQSAPSCPPAPPGLTSFLCRRNKQLIQVLGWLWDLSVTEEHIFSKAFFYFVCLDIMLYSGTCGLGMCREAGDSGCAVGCGCGQGWGLETTGLRAGKTSRPGKGRAWWES